MQRTVVIGDIHGCFDELLELVADVGLGADDLLVGVGDLVDRGPKPYEVVDYFRTRPNSIALMGNHERKHVRGIFSYSQEITRLQAGDRYAGMVDWMRDLPYYYENDQVRVVHAGMLPGIPLAAQREEILSGTTRGMRELDAAFPGSSWHDHYTDDTPIAFGHLVVGSTPLLRDDRIFGLDTGACHGGNLTAVSLPDRTIHSVPAQADHWSRTRREWQLPVLRSTPWTEHKWDRIDETVTQYSAPSSESATRTWLSAVANWTAHIHAALPALAAEADRVAASLDTEEIRRHPAGPILFQARRGNLDLPGLERHCNTPRRTLDLAAALHIDLPDPPR
ncbi:metallophosphoesterase [Nocardia sp. BMG111209]|uniref:metallophosphoesterase n=1 Tax=Nocardia sp. BMG111209 TaxID=1160137 RepID=UPI000361F60F|nr:metallophosphoesterase [Nocardia sp. BMG111209]